MNQVNNKQQSSARRLSGEAFPDTDTRLHNRFPRVVLPGRGAPSGMPLNFVFSTSWT